MLITLGMFMFNLLCGLVPCDPRFDIPQISSRPYPEVGFRNGKSINKLEIPAKVTVTQGKIEGYHMKTSKGRTIFAFEGIPYGTAERWKPSIPTEPWFGTLQTKKPGPDCLQLSLAKMLRVYGDSKNCLSLNVFTPNLPSKEENSTKYPSTILIHGGSFLMGAGSEHGPAYLLDEDVILVTINYRLGVLGFLSTGDSVIPGNWGLKDQALAIEWVKENIAQFQGDPDNINLWGYSAGAVATHLHMVSNRTKNIFKKGISMGGSGFQHWGLSQPWRARQFTNKLAKRFNCITDNSEALAKCLYSISEINLVAAQLNIFDWFPFPGVLFAPTIEPEHPDAFITHSIEEAYENGLVAKKPWILTTVKDEGITAVLVLELLLRWLPFRLSWKSVSKYFLDIAYIAENPDEITEKVKNFYLGDKSPLRGTAFEFSDMLTDRYFLFGIRSSLQAHSQIAPTYSSYFKFHNGKYSLGNFYGHKSYEWGAGHGEDDFYYFNCSTQYAGFKENDPEYKLSKILVNFMANFLTYGKPTYINEEGEEFKVWEPVKNLTDIQMLQIDEEIKMISMPNLKRLKFWQDLKLKDMVPWISIT